MMQMRGAALITGLLATIVWAGGNVASQTRRAETAPSSSTKFNLSAIPAAAKVPTEPHLRPGRAPIQHTRPTIEGAKNPKAIPDRVAYRHLFRMVLPGESAQDAAQARTRLRIVTRDPATAESLVAAARAFAATDQQIVEDITVAANANDIDRLTALKAFRDEKLDAAIGQLRHSLDFDRRAILTQFVDQHIKRQITIIY
jgi:hypothetical protein